MRQVITERSPQRSLYMYRSTVATVVAAYLHTRTYTLSSYRSVKGSFGALSFFYKHLTGEALFQRFPKLKISMKSLEKRFLSEKNGSIALSFDLIQDLLDFIITTFKSNQIESAVLYNLCIIAFWYMLRIGEVCRLSFDHCRLYEDPILGARKLRLTLIHPKTRSANYPDQFVTLCELPTISCQDTFEKRRFSLEKNKFTNSRQKRSQKIEKSLRNF